MHNKYLFVFLVFTLLSCNEKISRKQEIENCLTNGREKYWTHIPEYPIKHRNGTVYKSDGTYLPYVNSFQTGQRLIAKMYHKPTWRLKNDSTISDGMGVDFKIEYINNDILILNNLSVRQILVYLKSEDQKTKPVADTTKYLYPTL